MKAVKLAGIEPESVFAYFEKICSIPHGSGNTKMISDYLVSFAQEHNIRYIQDELNNVILFKEASAGYEDHAPVILQGHMDMVCEKDADCPINMETDGLDVTHDGTWVFANGTTLGGDDGIAVAYAMALLTDDSVAHPPLEIILTVDEETGLEGATGIDLSELKGRRMINLDSEEEGCFTAGCAGGVRVDITRTFEKHAVYGPCVKLIVDGLRGGHSGVEINRNRANANKIMAELLRRIRELMPLCLTKLTGGNKDNAIPRSSQAILVAMGTNIERINGVCEALQKEIRETYDEPDALVYGEDVDALGGNALSTKDTDAVIGLLTEAPNGVQSMSKDLPDLVQTSLNLGILTLDDTLSASFALRSSVDAEKAALREQLEELAKKYEAQSACRGDYPAWEYRPDSDLRDTMCRVYEQMTGKKAAVDVIHAGLECGILAQKLPGLDCVSTGPSGEAINTSQERLNIASAKRTWEFLLEVLKAL